MIIQNASVDRKENVIHTESYTSKIYNQYYWRQNKEAEAVYQNGQEESNPSIKRESVPTDDSQDTELGQQPDSLLRHGLMWISINI